MTFRGVTSARPVVAATLVCDIGGGSTELVLGGPGGVEWATSLEHGLRPPVRAPPARRPADGGARWRSCGRPRPLRSRPTSTPSAMIGVAGTITTLATIHLGLAEEIPELVDGSELTRDDVEQRLAYAGGHAARRAAHGARPDAGAGADHRRRNARSSPSCCERPAVTG